LRYEEVVRAVNEVLSEYTFRLTIRQIYYRLVSPPYQLFANTPSNYRNFDKLMTKAREKGDIDWRRIEDRARTTLGGDFGYDNPDEYLETQISVFKECWRYYTRRMWDNQDCYIEVWVEKDALATLFSTVASNYRVLTFPSRGYSSFTKVMEALTERFPRYIKMGKPIIILHFSDHDPSGLNMTDDIRKRLYDRKYLIRALKEVFTDEELNQIIENKKAGKENEPLVKIVRCALTYEQVQKYNLAPNPTKKADPRAKWYISQYGDQTWELDAVPPEELERIIEESIKQHINPDKWNETIKQIEEEKEKLRERLSKLRIEEDKQNH
jgi:hypothetical protein